MNWTIHVFNEPPLVRVTLRGLFDIHQFRRAMNSLAAAVDDLAFRPVLLDERGFDISNLTMPDYLELREIAASNHVAFASRKVAVLVSSAPAISVVNTVKEISLPVSDALISAFGEEHEALLWLSDPNLA